MSAQIIPFPRHRAEPTRDHDERLLAFLDWQDEQARKFRESVTVIVERDPLGDLAINLAGTLIVCLFATALACVVIAL